MRRGIHQAVVAAPAGDVFDLLTDVRRLPLWNGAIAGVVERPVATVAGASWVVAMRAGGRRWRSRSRAVAVDRALGLFTYESVTEDGDPSVASWHWSVQPRPDDARACTVVVAWRLEARTTRRRVARHPVRAWRLRTREVPGSLAALAAAAEAAAAARLPDYTGASTWRRGVRGAGWAA